MTPPIRPYLRPLPPTVGEQLETFLRQSGAPPLEPWQQHVLRVHPAFRNLRLAPPPVQPRPRPSLRRRLRRLLCSLCPCQNCPR